MTPDAPLNILVIGRGPWGNNIARDLKLMGGSSMSVTQVGRDWRGALKVIPLPHAVCIATPLSTHAEISAAFLAKGIPTYVEKPAFRTIRELDEVVSSTSRNTAPLFIGHTYCYAGAMQWIHRDMKRNYDVPTNIRGGMGREGYVPRPDCNALWDWGVHLVSAFLMLAPPVEYIAEKTSGGFSLKPVGGIGTFGEFSVAVDATVRFFKVRGAFAEYQIDANDDLIQAGHQPQAFPVKPLEATLFSFINAVKSFYRGPVRLWAPHESSPSTVKFTRRVLQVMHQLGPCA